VKRLLIAFGVLLAIGLLSAFGVYNYFKSGLPQIIKIEDYKPLQHSKVFDRNNKQIGEFFRERRILTPYDKIPKNVVNAFLSAEDDQFFEHSGINFVAIARAFLANIQAGRTVQGGSTITQQTAKTFFLSNERTLGRKIQEALLALELERNLSKEDILYLYLNQINFGNGAYGIGTAAEVYYRKPLEKLTLAEIAVLAGLPKAPSDYNPTRRSKRAKERQIYVLNRMADLKHITEEEATSAGKENLKVYFRENFETNAPYFLETIRQLLVEKIGEEKVLDGGVRIYTGLDLEKQKAATESVISHLKDTDKRQGFRGPLENFTEPQKVGEFLVATRKDLILDQIDHRIILPDGTYQEAAEFNANYDLKKDGLPFYLPLEKTAKAIVNKVDDSLGIVYVRMAELEGIIELESMDWARKPDPNKNWDLDRITKPSQALKTGDVILAKVASAKFSPGEKLNKILSDLKKKKKPVEIDFTKYVRVELDQEPTVQGALISFDQQTQDILAMVGGYDFVQSKFNRTIQAARQTGSSYKSIIYAAALDRGFTPATPIMDAPIVYEEENTEEEGQGDAKVWKPSNFSNKFSGDILFRNALVKSLNIPTVKIIEDIKVPYALDYSKRLGIFSPLNPDFTLALGSSSVTLYEMTKVFSQFGRGGKRTRPILIKKVEESNGTKILDQVTLDQRFEKEISELDTSFEQRRLAYLDSLKTEVKTPEQQAEELKTKIEPHIFFENPDQLIKPSTAYLITTLLKATIEDKAGTGARARALGREVAGKTGTTNGYYDAWFIGYTPQISTGVWVGHDQERSIGKGEVGGRSALPIWVDYMKAAHEELPQMTFNVPEGIVFANIDAETGELASASSKSVIRQAFLEGTEPSGLRDSKEEETDFYKEDLSE
jgi:penicillin-binding protein 1A